MEDVQVPPEDGCKVVLAPIQRDDWLSVIIGFGLMVILDVARETHPVLVLVKVKLAIPGLIPVTSPLFVIVATNGFDETQEPPVAGVTEVVPPIQIPDGPETFTTGLAFTVIGWVGEEGQPVKELVNVKVAVPGLSAVTTPALLTEAMAG